MQAIGRRRKKSRTARRRKRKERRIRKIYFYCIFHARSNLTSKAYLLSAEKNNDGGYEDENTCLYI